LLISILYYFIELKSVVIRAVPRVTTQGILKAVAHESMKHLEYIQENRVEEPFIVQLLQQNPNLEKVALHTNLEIAEKVFNEANQRVTKFIGLVIFILYEFTVRN